LNTLSLPPVPKARLRQLVRLGSRRFRRKEGLFVAESVRLVEEALACRIEIAWAVCTAKPDERSLALVNRLAETGAEVFQAAHRDLERSLDVAAPQALAAVCRIPQRSLEDFRSAQKSLVVVCDGVGDPGNLGSVIRVAAAAGCAAVLLAPGTVDPYNPRCVRGAMGALFRIPVVEVETAEILTGFLQRLDYAVFCADSGGENVFLREKFPARSALVLGSEARGLSAFTSALAPRRLAIPMALGVESLNVAVAAGTLFYRMAERQEAG